MDNTKGAGPNSHLDTPATPLSGGSLYLKNPTAGQGFVLYCFSILLLSVLPMGLQLFSVASIPWLSSIIQFGTWLLVVLCAIVFMLLGLQKSTTAVAFVRGALWIFVAYPLPFHWYPICIVTLLLSLRVVGVIVQPIKRDEESSRWDDICYTFFYINNTEYEQLTTKK